MTHNGEMFAAVTVAVQVGIDSTDWSTITVVKAALPIEYTELVK